MDMDSSNAELFSLRGIAHFGKDNREQAFSDWSQAVGLVSEDAKFLHVESRKFLIIQELMKVLPRLPQVITRIKSVDRGAVGSNFIYKDAAG